MEQATVRVLQTEIRWEVEAFEQWVRMKNSLSSALLEPLEN